MQLARILVKPDRLCVDQAVKPRLGALNSLRARERRLFADRQIGDAESAHPNTHPFGEYVNSSRVKERAGPNLRSLYWSLAERVSPTTTCEAATRRDVFGASRGGK